MGPLRHAALSAVVGVAVAGALRDARAGVAALVAGTAIDADHLVDYALARGLRIDLSAVSTGAYFRENRIAVVPLHGYEVAVVAGLLAGRYAGWKIGLGVTAGALVHLCWDIRHYGFRPLAYSLVYRITTGFRLDAFRRPAPSPARGISSRHAEGS